MSEREYVAGWKLDCQGKQDYDSEFVSLSTRYWPRGGGFDTLGPRGWQGNEARPEIRPSANATIILGADIEVASQSFEAETEAEVKADVEAWADAQWTRISAAIRAAYT